MIREAVLPKPKPDFGTLDPSRSKTDQLYVPPLTTELLVALSMSRQV